jgi:hypothetical protein
MPRFYFDVTDGGAVAPDRDGLDFPSLDAARQEAMSAAAEMAKEGSGEAREIVIRICDGGREPVATVRLSLTFTRAL